MTTYPAEAPWVKDMRRHFAEYGFYRREDLERLLGKPGDSVQITVNGEVIYRAASADTRPKGQDAQQGLAGTESGAVGATSAETPSPSPSPAAGR